MIDYDRILVLGEGKILEFDSPRVLLSKPDSEFSKMLDETGKENAAALRSIVSW